MKKISKTKLMSLLTEINRIDKKLYNFLEPYKRYPQCNGAWFFLDYHNILNIIYYEFYGTDENNCYKNFRTPGKHREDKPVAWYKTEYSSKNDGSVKGPKGYGGFIPDRINDVILSYDLKPNEKLKLLNRMFKDLKKLEQEYKANHLPQ